MKKRRIYPLIALAAVFGIALAVRLAPAQQEELDSLKVCAKTQKLLIENPFVRVIDDRIPAGVAEPKHKHAHGLTVVLTSYEIEQTVYPSKKIVRSKRKLGDVSWTEPTVHEVRNIGTTDSHVIRIELK